MTTSIRAARPEWVDRYAQIDDELSRRRHLAEIAIVLSRQARSTPTSICSTAASPTIWRCAGSIQMMAPTEEDASINAETPRDACATC